MLALATENAKRPPKTLAYATNAASHITREEQPLLRTGLALTARFARATVDTPGLLLPRTTTIISRPLNAPGRVPATVKLASVSATMVSGEKAAADLHARTTALDTECVSRCQNLLATTTHSPLPLMRVIAISLQSTIQPGMPSTSMGASVTMGSVDQTAPSLSARPPLTL